MAAYAALVSLMNNIEQIMSHPRLSTSLDNKYIQPLVEKAGFLLDFIEGCYNHGGGSKDVAEDLERRITSAAHAAEDVIESHIVDQIQARTSEVSLRCSLDLQQIIQDIDAIIKEATEEKQKRGEVKSTHNAGPLKKSGETRMVGLDDELTQLVDELTGYQSNRRIISIVGMGGTGKTTLATNIYQHIKVGKEHFDICAWATISQHYNAEEIISKLLSCIENSTTSETSGEALHKTLYGRRYLIVLDDIWSVEAWDEVRRYFPDDGNRSRVVLTTRLSNVANDCGSSYCLKMNLLDGDKSWKLFCDKASFPQINDPPQLEDVGKEIVKSCKGLALSIAVIGGILLKSPRSVGYWEEIAKDIKSSPNSKAKQESLDVLSLSYSYLPPHLKPCFLYMGVFKEDSTIHVSNMIKLWVGEGFIKPNGSGEMEEVAEGYVKDLIDRNLILAGRQRGNGKVRFCGIHDLLRDLALKIAKEQEFYHVEKYNIQGTVRRLVDYGVEDDEMEHPLARSIICSGRRSNISILLRVLYQENGYSEEDFSENVNLRYLTYKQEPYRGSLGPYRLDSSISLVWNLQTLFIRRHSFRLAVALAQFWKMRQLRHLKCSMIYLLKPPEDEGLMMEKLQTLTTALNLILSEEVCNIIPNVKKLYLKYVEDIHRYSHCVDGYDESCMKSLCNLNRFHKLESLKVRWVVLDTHHLNKVVRFPSSLKKLSLEGCELVWEDMEMLGLLPQLEVLSLKCNSVVDEEEWKPVKEQFLRLKFLNIRYCTLIVWKADSSHFPVLEKLLLTGVKGLKAIPPGIGEIPTLELICVDKCSESAAISAIKIKEDRVDQIGDNDDLQVQVWMGRSTLESFKQRLIMEELTINNIQFSIRDASINLLCLISISLL